MGKERKLIALKKVANLLNANNIVWAVGGSCLLFLKGITDTFNDIDIMISEHDVKKVKLLLEKYGELHNKTPSSHYKSKEIFKYIIDNVDFDIIAGFTIVTDNVEHYFPLKREDIKDFAYAKGITIPLQTIHEWKIYYSLMGRSDKVELINKFHMTQ